MFTADEGQRLSPLFKQNTSSRRQDLPKVISLNGAVYVAEVTWLLREEKFIAPETVYYEMPPERSVDIDTELDLMLAELLVKRYER
jgi:CMP-N-acetylneuraminic acid synthetase